MGALTAGQRETGSQGLFGERDNLEGSYAQEAKDAVFEDIARGTLPEMQDMDLTINDVAWQMGLQGYLLDDKGQPKSAKDVRMDQFLNRLMMLTPDVQQVLFDGFSRIMGNKIAAAIRDGTYDSGMETIRGLKTTKTRDEIVRRDERTGATVRYVTLDVEEKAKFMMLDEAKRKSSDVPLGVYRNAVSNQLWLSFRPRVMAKDGGRRIVEEQLLVSPNGTMQVIEKQDFEQKLVKKPTKKEITAAHKKALARGDDFAQRRPEMWKELWESEQTSEREKTAPQKFEKIPQAEEEAVWDKALADAPDTRTRQVHMLTGQVLDVWDQVTDRVTKIARARVSDTGERILGQTIRPNFLAATLQNLGVGQDSLKLSNEQALMKVRDEGATLQLSNGWMIKRSVYNGDERVELVGKGGKPPRFNRVAEMKALTEAPVNIEAVMVTGSRGVRLFFPMRELSQLKSMDAYLGPHNKIVKVIDKKTTQDVLDEMDQAQAVENGDARMNAHFVPYGDEAASGESRESIVQRAMAFARDKSGRVDLETAKETANPIREAGQSVKRVMGTAEEQLQAVYEDKERGTEIWERIQRYQIEKGISTARINAEVMKQFTKKEMWERIKKTPYVGGERGAAFWSEQARRKLRSFGARFGVAKSENETLFRAAEAALRLDADGKIVWGTKDPVRDANGEPIKDKDGSPKMKVRYTAEQGQEFWSQLSDQAKEALTWWVNKREQLKTEYEVVSDIEGYIHHHFPDNKDAFRAFESMLLKKKTARPRKLRKGKQGYLEDPQAAIQAGWTSLEHERLWNEYVEDLIGMMSEPLNDENPLRDGWKRIPLNEYTRLKRFIPKLGGGRQVPTEVYDDLMRFAELEEDVSGAAQTLRSLGRFWKTNMLLHPGTAATNTFGGALQYMTMVVEDFWRAMAATGAGVATGKKPSNLEQAWRKLAEDITAPIRALDPNVIYAIPPELFGAQSNVRTQFGPARSTMDKFNSIALWHYGAIENYWKRAIALSDLRSKGINPKKEDITANEKAIAEMNRVIDTFAFNYANQPRWMTRMKQSAVGSLVVPFPTYPYKLGHLYGRYVRALNPTSWSNLEGGAQEGLARALTMMSVMAIAMGFMYDEEDDKIGPWAKGMPFSTDRSGRIHIRGWDTEEGKERWLRTIKYPWLNLATAVDGGSRLLGAIFDDTGTAEGKAELGAFMGDMMGTGPMVAGAALLAGYSDEYSKYKSFGTRAGELAGTFVPLTRISQDLPQSFGDLQVKETPQTFLQSLLRSTPVPDSWTGLGKIRKDDLSRNKNDLAITNPTLDMLKFWLGINIREIDPRMYRLKKMKTLMNAIKRASRADTVDKFDRAVEVIQTLAPQRYAQIKERLSKKRILISERQIRRMQYMERKARRREALNTPTPVPAPAG